MNRIEARLLADNHFSVAAEHCGGCGGCGITRPSVIHLPGVDSATVSIGLTRKAQLSLLWHSWLKPLLALVIASLICAILQPGETVSITAAVLAFVAALATCHRMPVETVEITEEI